MTSWKNYPSAFNMGHAALIGYLDAEVQVEEKIDGCVTIDTPILKADLTYVNAQQLKVGDKLIAFEDTLNNPLIKESEVTYSKTIRKECYRIVLNDREIIASWDHPWLVRQKTNNNGKIWVKSRDLKIGMDIVAFPYWEKNNSWESGYLAGFFDGEGSLVKSNNQRILSGYQRIGLVTDFVLSLFKKYNFNFHVDIRQRHKKWAKVASMVLREGSWTYILKFLGTFYPIRLVKDSKKIWQNAPLNFVPDSKVCFIESVGRQSVQGLSTSTKTYIAKGLFSHNSQFSMGIFNGELKVRSKGQELVVDAPEKMFAKAVETAKQLQPLMIDGYTYRCEFLAKPKHNCLAYNRNPNNYLILFDVNIGEEQYLSYEAKAVEAERLGLECVPLLFRGILTLDKINELLERESVLGGPKIEGVVIKRYDLFGKDKKAILAKHVSEAFKEKHKGEWKNTNPGNQDIIQNIIKIYKHENRWKKAVQHLKEQGHLTDSPKDIGALMKEVQADILKEETENIQKMLWNWAQDKILRGCVGGLPIWYKEQLMKKQFDEK